MAAGRLRRELLRWHSRKTRRSAHRRLARGKIRKSPTCQSPIWQSPTRRETSVTTLDPRVYGRYQIVRKLAGGGMGRVFLAYDPTLNRQVGLKLIDSGVDRDSIDVVAAERRGASLQDQLAKREASGRVAQIFDVGDREGYFYI